MHQSESMMQDHSNHGASKKPMNSPWSHIQWFFWCTNQDQWYKITLITLHQRNHAFFERRPLYFGTFWFYASSCQHSFSLVSHHAWSQSIINISVWTKSFETAVSHVRRQDCLFLCKPEMFWLYKMSRPRPRLQSVLNASTRCLDSTMSHITKNFFSQSHKGKNYWKFPHFKFFWLLSLSFATVIY